MVRAATLADLNAIVEMASPYYYEASITLGRKLCRDRVLQTVYGCITAPERVTLLASKGAEIAGVTTAYLNYSFFDTPEMIMDFFYIKPEYRASGVSRLLVQDIIKNARDRGAAVLYCGCHSFMDDGGRNDKLFSNLFIKHGFKITGTNLHKEIA